MTAYDFRLALLSLRRSPGLSALMVLAIASGIAVCTISFAVYHAVSTNPIPWKNDQLYAVTLDTWDPQQAHDRDRPELPPPQLPQPKHRAPRPPAAPRHPARPRPRAAATSTPCPRSA